MTQNIALARLAALIGVAVSATAFSAHDVWAAKKASQPPQPADQASTSKSAFEAGTKAYAGGKYDAAVEQFSTALRTGGLSSADMAKALYLRGMAYKKLKKPGQAISDLTSALWLKDGLSESDRKTASSERSDAYRLAGLTETGLAGERVVADPAPAAPAAAKAAPAAAKAAPAAAASAVAPPASPRVADRAGVTRQPADSEAAREAARARQAAANPVDVGGLQGAAVATVLARPSGSSPAPAPVEPADPSLSGTPQPVLSAASTETAASAPPSSGGSSTVGGFFSNLFSGGSASANQAQPGTTASTSNVEPQTSSWNDATSVTSGKKARVPAATPVAANADAAAPVQKQARKGKYKVHIAAVRSRAEAEALAQKLAQSHAADLADHVPTVDEAVIGSMGTFYRVRVGGYVSQDEPRGLCTKLRSSGFDCLVVTN